MNNSLETRRLDVETICKLARSAPSELVAKEELRYRQAISLVAQNIHDIPQKRRIVMLCGPSSAGKTTTATLLQRELAARGTNAHVVSLDDFYLGRGKAPLLPSGKFDYETIEALDVQRLFTCMHEIIEQGRTQLPIFDFQNHTPKAETVALELQEDAAVIFEGIHAFHPRLQTAVPKEGTVRLFINTLTRFARQDTPWISRRDIRLARRILRDDQFRASPFSNTMDMWPQVVRGEELYVFPYIETADFVIDTTVAYEPCMLKEPLLKCLAAVPADDPHIVTARHLQEHFSVFPSMDVNLLPSESILHEFLG